MKTSIQLKLVIPEDLAGTRLDRALSQLLPDYSRTCLKRWLLDGQILIDDRVLDPKYKLKGGENITIDAHPPTDLTLTAQAIPLDIIYEDEAVIVINKPDNFVVHPAAGNPDKTLVNALLHHDPQLKTLPRAGLIHRIDKNTTGLLIVAKTLPAFTRLAHQLQEKTIQRYYETVVYGALISGGRVDAPIGRHPKNRIKMAVVDTGKPAVTHYRIAERFQHFTRLSVELETGRTHQIRVHMAHIQHPIVGDPLYSGRPKFPKNAAPPLISVLFNFKRQALHAHKITFTHPQKQTPIALTAPPPQDFQQLLNTLREYDL